MENLQVYENFQRLCSSLNIDLEQSSALEILQSLKHFHGEVTLEQKFTLYISILSELSDDKVDRFELFRLVCSTIHHSHSSYINFYQKYIFHKELDKSITLEPATRIITKWIDLSTQELLWREPINNDEVTLKKLKVLQGIRSYEKWTKNTFRFPVLERLTTNQEVISTLLDKRYNEPPIRG